MSRVKKPKRDRSFSRRAGPAAIYINPPESPAGVKRRRKPTRILGYILEKTPFFLPCGTEEGKLFSAMFFQYGELSHRGPSAPEVALGLVLVAARGASAGRGPGSGAEAAPPGPCARWTWTPQRAWPRRGPWRCVPRCSGLPPGRAGQSGLSSKENPLSTLFLSL